MVQVELLCSCSSQWKQTPNQPPITGSFTFSTLALHNSFVKLETSHENSYHLDDFWVDWFGEYAPVGGDVVNQLIEATAFHLFAFEIGNWVHEVEHDAALL